jgi:hypothetical protein
MRKWLEGFSSLLSKPWSARYSLKSVKLLSGPLVSTEHSMVLKAVSCVLDCHVKPIHISTPLSIAEGQTARWQGTEDHPNILNEVCCTVYHHVLQGERGHAFYIVESGQLSAFKDNSPLPVLSYGPGTHLPWTHGCFLPSSRTQQRLAACLILS